MPALLAGVFAVIFACAQSTADTTIYTMVEKMPVYAGGNDSLLKDITAAVIYPQACIDSGIQGKVYLRFVVNADGSIAYVHTIKSPNQLLSAAAIAATAKIKKFTPGVQQGKPVRVWYSVPVNFKVKTNLVQANTDTVYEIVDEAATYFGGTDKLAEDLASDMVYPREEFNKDIHGQVLLKAVILENGAIGDITVIQGISEGLQQEAIRIAKRLQPFKPGIKNGKPVKSFYNIPVDFNLHHSQSTIYMGSGFNSITFNMTFATTAGAADNKGKFLFYYYQGGFDGFMQEVNKNLIYPEKAVPNKLEAVIKINCSINSELKLVPLKSLNDPDNIFSAEAFRVINLLPAFKEELRSSSFIKDTLPVSIIFVLDKRHQWGQSAQTDEERADGFFDEGVYMFNKGKYLNSIDYFNSAIKTYSLHAKAFYNRGVALLKLYDTKGACEDFKTAFLLGDLGAIEAINQTCK